MSGANVAVVGSGGRESVLGWALAQSPEVDKVFGLPGNPSFGALNGKGAALKVDDLTTFGADEGIDLFVFGPEAPLIAGGADAVRAAGFLAIGPSAKAARLEGSKIFAQEFNERHRISCPEALAIAHNEYQALAFIDSHDPLSYVIKADGEAGGKGVGVKDTQEEADMFTRELFAGAFNNAAANGVVFQRRETGREVSSFWLIDKNGNRVNLGYSQDHKRLLDNDQGPNTGGMGAYSPVPKEIFGRDEKVQDQIIADGVIAGCFEEDMPYEGFLYNGLMIVENKLATSGIRKTAKVIEYNIRFGDPEAQVVIPRLVRGGMDMFEVLMAAAEGKLDTVSIPEEMDEAAVAICAAHEKYPDGSKPEVQIYGLDNGYENADIFYGGVRREDDGTRWTAGGRVVYVTGYGTTTKEARNNAEAVFADEPDGSGVYFEGMQRRGDIAGQAIEIESAA